MELNQPWYDILFIGGVILMGVGVVMLTSAILFCSDLFK